MTYKNLIKLFGSGPKAAKALGFTRMAVNHWKHKGIPLRTQELIEAKTNKLLKAEKI